jgi:hypothetical protein
LKVKAQAHLRLSATQFFLASLLPPPPPPPPPPLLLLQALRVLLSSLRVQCCKMLPIATHIRVPHPTLSYNPRAHALPRMRKPHRHWQTHRLLLAHRCTAAPSSSGCCIGCSICCKMHAVVANATAAAACRQRRQQRHSAAAAAGTSVGHARDVQRLHAAGCR